MRRSMEAVAPARNVISWLVAAYAPWALAMLLMVGLGGCTDKATEEEAEAAAAAEASGSPTTIDLWAGVPPLLPEADDIHANLEPRPGPLKPKQVGEVVEVPFPAPGSDEALPPPTGSAPPPGTPLSVVRFGPEGEPSLVDAVRLSFSHPMVPLASIDALEAKSSPIEISPAFEGTPKWLGTQTFAYVADGRIPFSTTYEVVARSGLASTDGATLPRDVAWKFTTPALELASSAPWDGSTNVDLQPEVVLTFNQPVNRTALLAALALRGGGSTVELVETPAPATPEGVTPPEPWEVAREVRVRPKAPLRPDTRYTLSLPGGVFGEGPNPSGPIRLSFSTYPPLRLAADPCRGPNCWTNQGIHLTSTTEIADPTVEAKIRVDPPIEDMTVWASSGIHINGKLVGETTYTVEVDAGLRDRFGQTLAAPFSTRIRVGPQYPSLGPLTVDRDPAVVERSGGGKLRLRVAGIDQVEVHARALGLGDINQFIDQRYLSDWDWPMHLPGPTFDDLLDVSASKRTVQTVDLDLSAMTTADRTLGWLVARSEKFKLYDWEQRAGYVQMFEVTDLGIAAALDRNGGHVLVTDLRTGLPVVAAKVRTVDQYDKELWSGITDPSGIAYVKHGDAQARVVTVETDDDRAYFRVDGSDLRGRWAYFGGTVADTPRAMFFTDRTPYKPGETIHLVGILRQETRGPKGTVTDYRTGGTGRWEVTTPRGIEVAKGEVQVSAFGTFTVDIETKEEHGTGNYDFRLTLPNLFSSDQTFYHAIPVETFRAPEFEVKLGRPDSSPLTFGEKLTAEIAANYLHGAPMVGADVQWTLRRNDGGFRPPGELNEGFSFARGPAWAAYRHFAPEPYGGGRFIEQGSGVTGTDGKLVMTHLVAAVDPKPAAEATPDGTEPKPDDGPPIAATYTLEATVTDDNRQAIGGQASFVVHAAEVYVGLRTDRTVLREGERVGLDAIVVDLQGERVVGRSIDIAFVRRVTERHAIEKNGRWSFAYETKDEPAGQCTVESGGVPARCEFDVGKAGTYVVRGTTGDDAGRPTLSETYVYVHGEDDVVWDSDQRRIDLVPDRSKYEPGDKAAILIRSPFTDATGVVLVEREGIYAAIPIRVSGGATAIEIPITEAMIPGVSISALLTRPRVEIPGAPPGQDLGMPAAAVGSVDLSVSTAAKTIAVELEPSATEVAPKDTLSLTIRTRDHHGVALPASVAIMVVDEGVLSLMNHQTPDPVAFFHHQRSPDTWMGALHANVMPRQASTEGEGSEEAAAGEDEETATVDGAGGSGAGYGYGGPQEEAEPAADLAMPVPSAAPVRVERKAADKKEASLGMRSRQAPGSPAKGLLSASEAMAQEVSLRTLFATTAFFDADVRTGDDGVATIEIPMPENLTTFRIMAVAVDPSASDRFGHADTSVRVRKPIMLRPSLPRFANFGDTFEGSVMVDNQTGSDQQVLVGTRGLNVEITGADQQLVQIPAGRSMEVRFDMKTMAVGTMRLQFAAMSNEGRDATQIELPVLFPATAESFADYGVTDDSVQRTIEPPPDALPGYGGLELSFSSTALNGLEDSVQYLVDYEYECAEQTASRILPIFVLGRILDEFPIASVRDDWRRRRLSKEGIAKLLAKQGYDGGFGYWKIEESWPYLTNWVTFALLEGKKAGYEVEPVALERALGYIENFVRYGHRTRWGLYYDWTSRAFGLWLLSRESRGEDLFDTVWSHRNDMPLYARAFLMSAAHRYGRTGPRDEVLESLRKSAVEGAKTIHFAESTTEAASDGLRLLMHSDVQTDAVALMTLLEVSPGDPMLPKVMAGIMAERDPREGGRWGTTHANAWALLAASRYFETVEKDEPDFLAKLWLDDEFGGELPFRGRSMSKVQQTVPMQKLAGAPTRTLTVAKDGPGKLYYRLGLRYAPKDLRLPARDQGFVVYRTYEPIPAGNSPPDPEAVKRLEDGSWQVKAGTNVKVTIHLVVHDRANYVVVDDALPAGFEGQNPRFVTSVAAQAEASSTPSYGPSRWWYPWWSFDHTEMRDDRLLLFADQLPAGVYTYSYTARATNLGTFQLPPIKAEGMYEPERFGRSASSVVRVVQ